MEVNSVWSDMKYLLKSSHVNYIVSIKCVHHAEWKYIRLAEELRVLHRFACFWDIGLFYTQYLLPKGIVDVYSASCLCICTPGCFLMMLRQINRNILYTWFEFDSVIVMGQNPIYCLFKVTAVSLIARFMGPHELSYLGCLLLYDMMCDCLVYYQMTINPCIVKLGRYCFRGWLGAKITPAGGDSTCVKQCGEQSNEIIIKIPADCWYQSYHRTPYTKEKEKLSHWLHSWVNL